MKVKTDPVMEAMARKLSGIAGVPPGAQARMICEAAAAGASALRSPPEVPEVKSPAPRASVVCGLHLYHRPSRVREIRMVLDDLSEAYARCGGYPVILQGRCQQVTTGDCLECRVSASTRTRSGHWLARDIETREPLFEFGVRDLHGGYSPVRVPHIRKDCPGELQWVTVLPMGSSIRELLERK